MVQMLKIVLFCWQFVFYIAVHPFVTVCVIETTVLFVIIKVMQSVVSVCSFVATVAFESTDLRNWKSASKIKGWG